MEQKVRIVKGIEDIENKINDIIREENSAGWRLVHITSHFSRQTIWCLMFEALK